MSEAWINLLEKAGRVKVTEEFHIGMACRMVTEIADRLGFGAQIRQCALICASELASNLYRHATEGGELCAFELRAKSMRGIEIVAEETRSLMGEASCRIREHRS